MSVGPLQYPHLLPLIVEQYALSPAGIHGVDHWARVLENGLVLAGRTGSNRSVIELFALFHDSGRRNDGTDPEHGLRGALLARQFRGVHCFKSAVCRRISAAITAFPSL